jgi:A/G-specific adenine glycosylase
MTAERPLPNAWDSRTVAAIRRKALAWFARHQRNLPWRESRDPYAIWVSEVMLQQTTVAAVVPHFLRFMARFPTVHALAAADEQAVLHQWQGLGYYRRARHLHAAAKVLANQSKDGLPDDPEVWAELPGVGRYILGAVLSQAFDQRRPIVEANTLRVFSRLCGSRLDPRSGEGAKWIWAAAEALLPNKNVGEFNQAMMELGALICTPANPACGECPLNKECEANRLGIQDAIPPMARRVEKEQSREVSLLIRKIDTVLVVQRPGTAKRWPLMWELPTTSELEGETPEQTAERLAGECGITIRLGTEFHRLRYGVTRFSITLTCFECEWVRGSNPIGSTTLWCGPHELAGLPASTPQRKLFERIAGGLPRELRLF